MVVVRINGLEWPSYDDDVVVAGNTVRQHDVDGTIVGNARTDAADMREAAKERAAGTVSIRREIDGIRPTIRVGHADTLIEHRPIHTQRLAAHRRSGGQETRHYQVCIGCRHHIDHIACCGYIVRFGKVLEDLVIVRVRLDEQLKAPSQRGRQQDAFTARVALALRERTGMYEIADDEVVIPEHAVCGKNDPIRPARGSPRTGALVRYLPAHADSRRIVNRELGRSHVAHRQIRVRR